VALIRCKECGKQISTKDRACPSCGATRGDVKRAARGCLTSVFRLVFGFVGAIVGLFVALYFLR